MAGNVSVYGVGFNFMISLVVFSIVGKSLGKTDKFFSALMVSLFSVFFFFKITVKTRENVHIFAMFPITYKTFLSLTA